MARDGVRDELAQYLDRLREPSRLRREEAVYGRLLAALEERVIVPDRDARTVLGDLAKIIDADNEYRRVVTEHEWGHALSLDRAAQDDIAAGERYLELLPEGFVKLVRGAGYGPREYTHEVVAEVYSMLMGRWRLGQTGQPPWLHAEVYELVRRVAGWNQ